MVHPAAQSWRKLTSPVPLFVRPMDMHNHYHYHMCAHPKNLPLPLIIECNINKMKVYTPDLHKHPSAFAPVPTANFQAENNPSMNICGLCAQVCLFATNIHRHLNLCILSEAQKTKEWVRRLGEWIFFVWACWWESLNQCHRSKTTAACCSRAAAHAQVI